jgi:transposase-like protein
MANRVRTLVEVQENAWTRASGKIIGGVLLFIAAVVVIYSAKYFARPVRPVTQVVFALIGLAGLGLAGAATYNGIETRKLRGVGFACPYCDRDNRFEGDPNESFECEYCNRTIHFEDGMPVPVRAVSCPFCHTDHRVAVNVQRYVCDKCNRPLELATESRGRPAAVVNGAVESSAGQQFDVLLLSVDRRQENEVALKLQNLLVVNLAEARRLMATATMPAPLVVCHGLPQRKAEAIRRQLQDLGATATLRPVNDSARTPPRTR